MQTAATVASDSIKTKRKVADGEGEQMFAPAQETTSTWRQSSIQYSVFRKRAAQSVKTETRPQRVQLAAAE